MLPDVDFAESDLSRFIEDRIHRRVLELRKQRAADLHCDPEQVPSPTGLHVRLLLNNVSFVRLTEFQLTSLAVGPSFQEYFRNFNYPSSIPYTEKCICLFQVIIIIRSSRDDSRNRRPSLRHVRLRVSRGSSEQLTQHLHQLPRQRPIPFSRPFPHSHFPGDCGRLPCLLSAPGLQHRASLGLSASPRGRLHLVPFPAISHAASPTRGNSALPAATICSGGTRSYWHVRSWRESCWT